MKHVLLQEMTDKDIKLLYETVKVAHEAMLGGNHPFGALLADENGEVLLRQGNCSTHSSPCLHAETALMIEAGKRFSPEKLASCSLYSTAEPCVMCCGAMYWTNVRRLVYGISEVQLLKLTGSNDLNPTFSLPCIDVFESGQKDFVVCGPAKDPRLIAAIIEDHKSFWKSR
ncbi:MAG: nucleoside deaminase [Sphaerochaetaceae bacterium]|nr:nucleoside deaminase [Candidatus Cloacimonadota bacterium]MDD2232110.1 nucleoside deaminase [Sphaerochaetaceae bacterium]